MSTTMLEANQMTTVHVERICACPFSMAQEYAVQYLKHAEAGGPEAVIRAPLPSPLPALGRKVSMSFGLAIDVAELGRTHDEIHLRWNSGSVFLPLFHGTMRFRIDGTRTIIAIDGSYEASWGVLGRWFDRIAGRWIARRTLDDLARRIGRYLEQKERAWRAAHGPAGA